MERIKHFIKIFFIHVVFIVAQLDTTASHAAPDILNVQQFQRNYPTEDPRRLSPSEQAQILSDVQQHRPKFRIQALGDASPTEFTSLAKYKVDRAKQQEAQRQLEQQKLTQQHSQNFFDGTASRFQPGITANQNDAYRNDQQRFRFQQPTGDQFANVLQPNDPSDIIFDDSRNNQLRNYFEKQRQLEILQLQREQLLAEQREIRRQQELLRLEQLRQLTTTTTTQTPKTTTYSPLLYSSPSARSITPAESNLFLKAIANHQKKFSTTPRTPITAPQPTPARVNSHVVEAQESQNNEQLVPSSKSGPQIQIIYQTEKPPSSAAPNVKSSTSRTAAERDALIKQLKVALGQSPLGDGAKNISTRDIVLPNGKTIQLIKAPNGLPSVISASTPSALPPTTVKPPKAIIDELTKGVLPPGADFEVLRHKVDGNVEEIDKVPLPNVPSGKKVTFVVLEEQSDGSYKVQGVKGNDNDQPDVASIVQRIKTGELKLPPSSRTVPSSEGLATTPLAVTTPRFVPTPNTVSSNLETTLATTSTNFSTSPSTSQYFSTSPSPSQYFSTNFPRTSKDFNPFGTLSSVGVTSTTNIDRFVTAAATPSNHILDALTVTSRSPHSTTLIPNLTVTTRPTYMTTNKYFPTVRSQFVPTMAPVNEIVTRYQTDSPTTISYSTVSPKSAPRYITKASHAPTPRSIAASNSNVLYEEQSQQSTTIAPVQKTSTRVQKSEDLVEILRGQSLYAMAKFLKQSRLDSVLNETGPYTIFVPTDKAFRTLLVQLGGPEKAEEKFQENPRLLSGLLLHHVVPGAFRIDSLQDEMTGVSLAGTQLRVNVYSMQDIEWNDVKLTTINGARVSADKRDIKIPQGIAHAIDRVMFPLPVGDLVQTLQADRERRFTTFLRALHASGLEDTFSDSKTFTIFAPTNSAFAAPATVEDQAWLANEENREAARALVSRHVVPSTLFTVGMRYYQQKDTLSPETPLHIYKNGGRVKVNNGHVVTHNIPATNGVVHAVDVLL